MLVAGRHRLEGARRLGWGTIACSVVEMDERQARMWEIAENLHRADRQNWRGISRMRSGSVGGGRGNFYASYE